MKSILLFIAIMICIDGYSQENVDYKGIDIDCLFFGNTAQNKFIINSSKAMDEIRKLRVSIPQIECGNVPNINFSSKTLIGYIVNVGSCSDPSFQMNFTKEKGHYYIKVTAKTTGVCRMAFGKTYWMLIDKEEDANLFHFETEYL
ncbi:MAG: hypothetical protein ACJA08_001085 [Cyclobacteriaceae bacterium]|jgi:hypothetical protein